MKFIESYLNSKKLNWLNLIMSLFKLHILFLDIIIIIIENGLIGLKWGKNIWENNGTY